jgi:hypothetical protein
MAVSIDRASDDLRGLLGLRQRIPQRNLSLRIERVKVTEHDKAVQLLARISNSVFFAIDAEIDVALGLARQRRLPSELKSSKRGKALTLQFPEYEYDDAPMSLYWYARSARKMPLLQFLAYYQTIEYYFPAYAEANARRKIKNIVKDPGFRGGRDADRGRIPTAIKGRRGSNFGDERSQLRATLQECLDPDALRSYLESETDLKKFLSTKAGGLTGVKIPINNPTADLRNEVAERIYDIRCRIVHTKKSGSEDDVDMILPFSKEEQRLYFDNNLIEYVSRKVLIAASTPLRV